MLAFVEHLYLRFACPTTLLVDLVFATDILWVGQLPFVFDTEDFPQNELLCFLADFACYGKTDAP